MVAGSSAAAAQSEQVKPFDHTCKDRAAQWRYWLQNILKPHMEKVTTSSIMKITVEKYGNVHFTGSCSTFLYVPLTEQESLLTFPKLHEDSAIAAAATKKDGKPNSMRAQNAVRRLHYLSLQVEMRKILFESFGTKHQELFHTYDPYMLDSSTDLAALPKHSSDESYVITDFWPFATYIFLTLQEEYSQVQTFSIFSLMTDYDKAVRSFNGKNFTAWRDSVQAKKFELDKNKKGPECRIFIYHAAFASNLGYES